MDNFEVVKLLCASEKIFNIHRNYLLITKSKRIVTTFMILLDVIISTYICIDNLKLVTNNLGHLSHRSLYYASVIILLLHVLQSVLIVIYFGPRYGVKFKNLFSGLSYSHHLVQHHPPYRRVLEQLKKQYLLAIILLGAFRILIVALAVVSIIKNDGAAMLSSLMFVFLRTLCQVRCVIGILLYCSLVDIIRSIIQTVRELVREAMDNTSLQDNLDTFVSVYRQLLHSCRQLQKCLGHQTFFSLFVETSHFIYVVYRFFSILLTKTEFLNVTQPNVSYFLVLYTGIFIVVAKKCQEVRNDVTKLKQILAKILYKTSADPKTPTQTSLKEFLRLVTLKPLVIVLPPTMPVGMYLLPVILSLTVNYIIVSLQMTTSL